MAADIEGGAYKLDLTAINAGFDRLIAQAGQVEGALVQSAEAGRGKFAEAAQAALAYNQSLAAQAAEVRNAQAATRDAMREVQRLTQANRDLAAAQKEASKGGAEYKRLQGELDKNTAKIREAKAAILENKVATEQEAAAVVKLREARAAEVAQTKLAAAAAKDAAAATKDSSKESSNSLSGIKGAIVGAFSFAAVKEFFSNVVAAGQATEATLSKLQFANGGNAQAGARDLAFIRNEADRLGLDLNAAGNSYGSFAAAATAANFPLAEARRLFLATAGASATLKLSASDTEGVLTALTQILSKGTVSAEELRGQIGERLPGAFAIAAKSIGVTEKELTKLLETGQLSSAEFLPKFAAELQKTFGDGTAQAADSFTANLNRIENEFQAFFLRFEGTASAGVGRIAKFAKLLNEGIDNLTSAGRARLGEKQAQEGIKNYGDYLDRLVAERIALAKTFQQNVEKTVTETLDDQRSLLEGQRESARKELAAATKAVNDALLPSYVQKDRETEAARRLALLDGEIAKVNEVATARAKANAADNTQGLIEKQIALIKALKARQAAAANENDGKGGDFLFGKGGLNAQLKAAEAELKRLEGIVDKSAAARQNKLEAALRALEAERETLRSLAAKAAVKDADDASARATASFNEALRQVETVKQKLVEKERAVRAAGGRGANADGVIDGAQAQALTQLRLAALDTYYTDLYKITAAREQRLFDLRADSNGKEIEAVDRKYDALIARAKDNIERQAIEEARQREQLRVRFEQQAKADNEKAAAATSAAQLAGNTFGAGTGVSVIEAKRAEKKALLEIERQHLQDVLNNSLLLGTKEGEAARAAAQAQLAVVRQGLAEVDREKKAHAPEDFIYKLIFGENDSPQLRQALNDVAASVANSFSQILASEQQAASARASTATQAINELGTQIQAQIALREEGSASNIKGLLAEQEEQKRVRREALAEQRKLAQEQVIIDALSQASSITTAAANVFAAFSEIPYVGVALGIAAAGVLIGGFTAAKIQAYEAAGKTGSFFVGGYTGDGDARQVSTAQGARSYEYHKREFIMNHELTDQYRRDLFEPLHQGRPQDIAWDSPQMRALLPDEGLPGRLRAERAASVQHHYHVSQEPVRAELAGMRSDLAHIKQTNASMADRPDTVPLPDGYLLKWPNGSTQRVKLIS